MPSEHPRLELTWPNKYKFLLVPKDAEGKPVWVTQDHPATSEVRLTEFTSAVGEVNEADRCADNLLFTGDSLDVLRILAEVPEYRQRYQGKIKLCYIDPPFNTGQTFEHYDDWMEHSTWLSFMRDRLLLIKDLLAPDGTVWIHLDNYEIHRMRLLVDEVFGAQNYLSTVVWQRTSAKSLARRTMGTMYDNLLIYGKSDAASLTPVLLPYTDGYLRTKYSNNDDRGRYRLDQLTAASHRPHLDSGQPWGGHDPSSRKRCWAAPIAPLLEIGFTQDQLRNMTMREKLDELDRDGYIVHSKTPGGAPQFKRYLNPDGGIALGDFWADINVINSQGKERLGYTTQKPEALVARIITMSTAPGDIVLDCFVGSGTTVAVAQKMRRRWIGVDISAQATKDFVGPRLEKVVAGSDSGGVTGSTGWNGGGGFRTVDVGPSMYEVTEHGVMLAGWATNGPFARAVAGQLGFEFESGSAPFCGTRGRMRLAVFDGAAGPEEIRDVVSNLSDTERVTVIAKVVLPGVEETLKELSKGSRIRKAPRDVLDHGSHRRRKSNREGPA